MLEPKLFYRDFDNLLQKIGSTKTREGFVCSILMEVKENFGERLHIVSIRLYEDRGDEFVLINKFEQPGSIPVKKIPANSPAIRQVLEHGSYVYDDETITLLSEMRYQDHYAIPAAITIRSPEKRWVAVFEISAGWEREELVFSLNAIRAALNHRLFAEAIKSEIEQAAQIQRSLLPAHVPEIPGYQFAARSLPAEVVGGDFYDFYEFDDEVFGICVGDASGHGLPAALVVRDCVIGLRMGLERQLKMVHSFQKLNSVIYKSTYSSRFVSVFYGELEKDGHMIFVNAGHPSPFVVTGSEVTDLKATGLIIGALPEINIYRSFAHVKPGSLLVFYTDGIFERENREEESFTIDRLKQLVIDNQEKTAQEIVNVIFESAFTFGHGAQWEDDATVVVLKRLLEGPDER